MTGIITPNTPGCRDAPASPIGSEGTVATSGRSRLAAVLSVLCSITLSGTPSSAEFIPDGFGCPDPGFQTFLVDAGLDAGPDTACVARLFRDIESGDRLASVRCTNSTVIGQGADGTPIVIVSPLAAVFDVPVRAMPDSSFFIPFAGSDPGVRFTHCAAP